MGSNHFGAAAQPVADDSHPAKKHDSVGRSQCVDELVSV